MTANTPRARVAWEDRFRKPRPDELLEGYSNKQLSHLAAAARAALAALPGVREAIAWQGLPWRWTWIYDVERRAGSNGSHSGHTGHVPPPALAYLIPDPQHPRLAVPLSAAMVEPAQVAKLKRFVRDGLAVARVVGRVYWPCWDLANKTQLEEVLDLVVRKHRLVTGAPAPTDSGAAEVSGVR